MIRTCPLPSEALLARYSGNGGYADCYTTEVPGAVSHSAFIEAFYTGLVFKLERLLLTWLASQPSTDAQARQLAAGALDAFSAWRVEARTGNQLLMRSGRTRSWFMTAPEGERTRLYFGSAVVPQNGRMGFLFNALLGFHKIYSRILLRGACSRIRSTR